MKIMCVGKYKLTRIRKKEILKYFDYKWKSLLFLIISSLSFITCSNSHFADFYVSPYGNDSWSGKLATANNNKTDGPFKTLIKARNAVRGKIGHMNKDIVVMLRGGTYFLDSTLVFGLDDSGREGYNVVYCNYPNEEPVFTSGVKINNWEKLNTDLSGLGQNVKDKVWMTKVPERIRRFYTLRDGEQLLPRARSVPFKPLIQYNGWFGGSPESLQELKFPDGILKDWPNLEDVEISIIPTADWTHNILGLSSVNTITQVANTNIPGTYALGQQFKKGRFPEGNCWVENVPEVLDEPGEWIYNSKEGKVYYYPLGTNPGNNIVIPTLKEFIKVQGDSITDVPVRNIVFRGLTFTCGKRDTWTKSEACLQHDWESYDKDNALIRFRGAENCTVEECHFRNSGACAIRLDLYCQKIRIANNLIEHMGSTGIVLAGYGPGSKDVNKNNLIFNNHIHHCGEIYWHCPGIFIFQSGNNRVSNNLIHDTPYSGLIISGCRYRHFLSRNKINDRELNRTIRWNEVEKVVKQISNNPNLGKWEIWDMLLPFIHSQNNIVENNEIFGVMKTLGDGNGIYLSGAGTGNLVRQNYVHDFVESDNIPMKNAALRTDECQKGTTFTKNIIYKCAGGGFILKGQNNCENNIIANLQDSYPIRGYIWVVGGPVDEIRIQKNIFYHTGNEVPFYYIRPHKWLTPFKMKDSNTDKNIFYYADNPEWSCNYLNAVREDKQIDYQSICSDPLFIDLKNGNFHLKPESPAFKLGFKQIEMDKIGLTDKFPKRFNKKAKVN